MEPDPELIYSPYCQSIERDGIEVEVWIFKIEGTDWTLEVVDEFNNSTVWDEEFKTDQDAFKELEKTLREEGIETMSGKIASE